MESFEVECMRRVEKKLTSLGYRKIERKLWLKDKKTVRVVNSSEYNRRYVRILWREEWKDYDFILYDYSSGGGPVCIIPVKTLFTSPFAIRKRKESSYSNSGNWWSQKFPFNHEVKQLVFSFKNRWELL
jgi:hypothetical protein